MKKTRAHIIGSGIGGLAMAIRLASKGMEVHVFEKNSRVGGKMDEFRWEGFRWDKGPSLFTLPTLAEELFHLAGREMSELVPYEKLDVITRYFFQDRSILNAYGDPQRFAREVEEVLGESRSKVQEHLDQSRVIYDLSNELFIFSTFMRIRTFLSRKFIVAMGKLAGFNVLRSMHRVNAGHFLEAKVVQLFDRYATYNGSDPYRAPGTLNVISHLEHNLGAYFPDKGMYSIATGLQKLAESMGVHFHFEEPVSRVEVEGRQVKGVHTPEGYYASDLVVSDVDIYHFYKHLATDIPFPRKRFTRELSTSAMIFYWAMDRPFPQLDLHNIFFSEDYAEEFRVLSGKQGIHSDPTVYVFISSKKVHGDAPEGKENWFVMINVPSDEGQDWEALRQEVRSNILRKLEHILQEEVSPHILHEEVADPRSIEAGTSSHRGALYGLSSNSPLAAFARHPNYLRKYKGLYFVGGSVHPGGGIPLCMASAGIADEHISTHYT